MMKDCHMCHGDLEVLVNFKAQPCPNKIHQLISCPFCNESDFDEIGLKFHILNYCEDFDLIGSAK